MRTRSIFSAAAGTLLVFSLAGCTPGQDAGLERRIDTLVSGRGAGGSFTWADVEPGDWTTAVVVVPCAATAQEINQAIGVDWDAAGAVSGGSQCISSDRWVYLVAFEKDNRVASWGFINREADGTDVDFPDNLAVGPHEKLQLRRNIGDGSWEVSVAASGDVGDSESSVSS